MEVGKLNWTDLKNLIRNNNTIKREEVRVRSGVGEDCAVVNFGEYECVISTDPITGATKNIGKLAVHINCNDIASSGVEPLGITVTILVPPSTTYEEINQVMKDINEETSKLNVEIIGGHTEVTPAVNQIIVSCTVFGKCLSGTAIASSTAKIGDDIIVTKYLAQEGTSIIANEYEERTKNVLSSDEYNEAINMIESISVVKEGLIASSYGVNSMHDVTEGGILGALWEVAEASNVGFEIIEKDMPIKEITKKICSEFSIDPLRLISSGSMLITCKNGDGLVRLLKQEKINAKVIGKITESKGIMISRGEEKIVTPPETDDLFKIN